MTRSGQSVPIQWVYGCLIALPLIVYGQVVSFDFVAFDDAVHIYENRHVLAGMSWDSLVWAMTSTEYSNWQPLTRVTLLLDRELYGDLAGGYHLTNLCLHIANTVLLFQVLRQLTDSCLRSALVAALFSIHPINVEAVAWVSERKGLLSTLFFFLMLCAYLRYVAQPSRYRYLLTFSALTASMLAKQMMVTAPFLLILLDAWPLNRIRRPVLSKPDDSEKRWGIARSMAPVVIEKLPLILVCLVFAGVAVVTQRNSGSIQSLEILPITSRVANAITAYSHYLMRVFWPKGLSFYYPLPAGNLPIGDVAVRVFLLSAISAICLRQRSSRPYLIVGWLWFIVSLLPVIGLVQIGGQQTADRYMYVPSVGLFIVVVWTIPTSMFVPARRAILGYSVVAGMLVSLGAIAAMQAGHWRNSISLFENAVAVDHHNKRARFLLAVAYREAGRRADEDHQYETLMKLDPSYLIAAFNSHGEVLRDQFRYGDAIEYFNRAKRADPGDLRSYVNLGIVQAYQQDFESAISNFRFVLDRQPDNARVHILMAAVLMKIGKEEEAQKHLRQATSRQRRSGLPGDDGGATSATDAL